MSEDLIKRSDAIGAITNHCENECYYRVDNWCPQCQREEFEEAIKAVPSADRPQGEWMRYMGDIWTCSACGESLMCDDIECNNFCPNCGADMREGECE